MARRKTGGEYAEIAAKVLRDNWELQRSEYPLIFTNKNLADCMGISSRMVSMKMASEITPWNVTIAEMCLYADAVGIARMDIFQMFDNEVLRRDGGNSKKRMNRTILALKAALDIDK